VANGHVDRLESAECGIVTPRSHGYGALKLNLQKSFAKRSRLKGLGGALVSMAIAAGAVYALTHALKHVHYDKVFAIVRTTDFSVIALSLMLVTASYGSITLYDWLALHTMGRRDVPYRIAALASFTSYPIAHGIGAVALISPVIRYRIYSGSGLTAFGVANICFLTGLTFWLGNMTALGFSLLYEPAAISVIDHLPPTVNRALATVLLGAVGVFLIWSWWFPRRLGRGSWSVQLPSGPLVLLQIVVGLLDLTAAALAMYVLLPPSLEIGPFRLLAVFIAATLFGFASHVPAGLGVFDATILIGLGGESREQLLAALLMFRFLYHFVPLLLAVALLGCVEVLRSLRARKAVAKKTVDQQGISHRRIELQPDHSGNDQRQADEANRIGRLAVENHADDDAADGADAGPHRIRRAEGQGAQRQRHQGETEHDGHSGGRRRPEPRQSVGIFEAKRPADLEQPGAKQRKPGAH
jgi:glycosyltransferase 2 family protein